MPIQLGLSCWLLAGVLCGAAHPAPRSTASTQSPRSPALLARHFCALGADRSVLFLILGEGSCCCWTQAPIPGGVQDGALCPLPPEKWATARTLLTQGRLVLPRETPAPWVCQCTGTSRCLSVLQKAHVTKDSSAFPERSIGGSGGSI